MLLKYKWSPYNRREISLCCECDMIVVTEIEILGADDLCVGWWLDDEGMWLICFVFFAFFSLDLYVMFLTYSSIFDNGKTQPKTLGWVKHVFSSEEDLLFKSIYFSFKKIQFYFLPNIIIKTCICINSIINIY